MGFKNKKLRPHIIVEIKRRGVLPALGGHGFIEQSPSELVAFTELIWQRGSVRYLEIGTSTGALLDYMIGFVGLDGWGINLFPPNWRSNRVYVGDCMSKAALTFASEHGPYDLILIDADHSYESVSRSSAIYSSLASDMVAYHDICGLRQCDGAKRFWDEVKACSPTKGLAELISLDNPVGIGIVSSTDLLRMGLEAIR